MCEWLLNQEYEIICFSKLLKLSQLNSNAILGEVGCLNLFPKDSASFLPNQFVEQNDFGLFGVSIRWGMISISDTTSTDTLPAYEGQRVFDSGFHFGVG